MVSEEIYELCVPILQDKDLNEEDQVEKIEEIVKEKTSLSGSPRDNAVLDILWRHRGSTKPGTTPPVRHKVIRRTSPAAWQLNRTPSTTSQPRSTTSPAPPPGLPVSRPSFPKSSTVSISPFTSPRPSPRLALAKTHPNAYQFSDPSAQSADGYGDLGRDNVDWIVNDDAPATPSRQKAPSVASSVTSLSAAAPEFQPPPPRMNPYDSLRSLLGDRKSDEEIGAALEEHGYDLRATMAALTGTGGEQVAGADSNGRVLVGKSMSSDQSRPLTPANAKSIIVCKYWSTTGQCLRADCRFSHDLTQHICKYWIKGACLAGDGCSFSHDPSAVAGSLNANNGQTPNIPGSPGSNNSPGTHPLRNSYDSFPALQSPGPEQWPSPSQTRYRGHAGAQGGSPYRMGSPSNGSKMRGKNAGMRLSQANSRPGSRQRNRDSNNSALSVDDPDAFPTLSSTNTKGSNRKQQTKKGQNKDTTHRNENNSSPLNVVRVPFSSSPIPHRPTSKLNSSQNYHASPIPAEKAEAASAIPSPKNVPWFAKEPRYEKYKYYRGEGIENWKMRNGLKQTSRMTLDEERNPAKAAGFDKKAEWYAERSFRSYKYARMHLYDLQRDYYEGPQSLEDEAEAYIDLHTLTPPEALEYIEPILMRQEQLGRRLLYIITGTSYTKNKKDPIAKVLKTWLNSWQYTFHEFSLDGESPCYDAVCVLGVDPMSYWRNDGENGASSPAPTPASADGKEAGAPAPLGPALSGNVQLLKREGGKDAGGK
ncbi:hypothetical protein FQN54_000443 [Arachnomyces sp. PD_36]|nr:hypothetical protein FQN54_000443 [Arachnomyces sp. PD_36]